jgi:hypothetical protein
VRGAGINVRITQIDGTLPNLALMRIAAHHRARGDRIHFSRGVRREIFEPEYSAIYGSAIFECKSPDAYDCWSIRYNGHICFSSHEVEKDGGPCECTCHQRSDEGDGSIAATPRRIA